MKLNEKQIFSKCKDAQIKALSEKILVGAVVEGVDKEGNTKYFSGSNIHVSDSFPDIHAEQLAINLCLLERYYPIQVYVTSKSAEETVIMCGSCRHYFSEVNEDIFVTVFNPDGMIKANTHLTMVYPARKNVKKKNMKFQKICGFKGK